ncbi:hypothetical protein KGY79_13575 [Candidatus Bipolaricaulota bacterium]|nr:hypothetical protein [Candidatus Bipolaricaulota bacterium]
MKEIDKKSIIAGIEKQFQSWFQVTSDEIELMEPSVGHKLPTPELTLRVLDKVFRVAYSKEVGTAKILSTVEGVQNNLKPEAARPVICVVPYMTKKGKEKCGEYNLSWLDLSGNAHIEEPPIYVHVEGKENRFKQSGRPASVFAPEASKIPLTFLLNPKKSFTVKEIVQEAEVSSGTASRVTRRLESLGFIRKIEKKGRSKPYELKNPFTMLDAWAEDYDFSRHEVTKGAIAETRGGSALSSLKVPLGSLEGEYCLSGPRAAEFYGVSSGSPLTVVYIGSLPSEGALKRANFVKGKRGSNLWLVEPRTSGVFMGTEDKDGLSVVNQIQLYLDLQSIKAQRSEDLAEELFLKIKRELEDAGF